MNEIISQRFAAAWDIAVIIGAATCEPKATPFAFAGVYDL
jgi:hypothetical protein